MVQAGDHAAAHIYTFTLARNPSPIETAEGCWRRWRFGKLEMKAIKQSAADSLH